jgi:hypothetical protein
VSLIKKIDVDRHFAEKQAMRLGRTGPLSRQSARKEPAPTAKNAPSPLSAPAAPALITTDPDKASVFTVLRNRQA